MVAASAADAKVRSPPPPLKAALSRSIAASLARAHRRLAHAADGAVTGLLLVKAAGDTFLCLCLAAAWLLAAGVGAVNLGRVFCGGDGCAAVDAGGRVFCRAALGIGIFGTPAMLVFVYSDTDDKEGRAPSSFAAAAEEVLADRAVMLGVLASLLFHLLIIVGGLLKVFSLTKDSATGHLGSQMSAVGTLGKDAMWCFVIIPAVALKVWRVTRPGWRCCNIIEMALAAGAQEVLYYPAFAMFATVPFLLLMLVGGLLNWEMMISVGSVGSDVMWFFVIIPTAAVRVGRVTRPGWRYEIEGGDAKLSEDLPIWRTWRMTRPAL